MRFFNRKPCTMKFSSGHYGIRKWTFSNGYEFFDIAAYKKRKAIFWWSTKERFFQDCKGTAEDVLDIYNNVFAEFYPVPVQTLIEEVENNKCQR